eukprot:TRINITY_DN14275_c0_g6_i2.p1 TRINITY_DN14275_c0_g6~~TRINITY_DN14275_c0_g6_i2.p1  ORF type:complete len:252 (+),score=25.90 TRINITY_DN14275_c0_g6_i2:669-1424(+)
MPQPGAFQVFRRERAHSPGRHPAAGPSGVGQPTSGGPGDIGSGGGSDGVSFGQEGFGTPARRFLQGGPAPDAARPFPCPATAPSLSPAASSEDTALPCGGASSPETWPDQRGMIYIREPLSSALRGPAAEGTGHVPQSSRAAPCPMSASPRARGYNGRQTAPADVDAAAAGLVRLVADASAQTDGGPDGEQPPQAQWEEMADRIQRRLEGYLDARLTAMEDRVVRRVTQASPGLFQEHDDKEGSRNREALA